jgi:hypothetical protein
MRLPRQSPGLTADAELQETAGDVRALPAATQHEVPPAPHLIPSGRKAPVTIDRYTKTILTIIAIALVLIALRPEVEEARAETASIRCLGKLTANMFGAVKERVGGYEVDVTCR